MHQSNGHRLVLQNILSDILLEQHADGLHIDAYQHAFLGYSQLLNSQNEYHIHFVSDINGYLFD